MAQVNTEELAQKASDLAVEKSREVIRAVRQQAWEEGYRACYEGNQRHNPYIKKESD